MRTLMHSLGKSAQKAQTGVVGFDSITGGGLPRGRTTLLVGGPGSGKTIFALQFLVHGARACKEPGIFVAFEEASDRIVANAEGFGWDVRALQRTKLFFLDAQPSPDLIQAGSFDLGGMLAMLAAKSRAMGARRIVFDALDILLVFLPDEATRRREVYRLHEWLIANGLTALITAKAGGDDASSLGQQPFGFMQFMVDCAVVLNHSVTQGVSQRNLRVQKYRGTAFDENESPFVIGSKGFDEGRQRTDGPRRGQSAERVANEVAEVAGELKRVSLDAEEAVLEVRAKSLQTELLAKQVEKTLLARTTESRAGELSRGRIRMRELRGGDIAVRGRK